MAEQVTAVATGRTAITARSGDGVPTEPAESPVSTPELAEEFREDCSFPFAIQAHDE